MFHLRNLLGGLGLRSKIVSLLSLLIAGLVFGLMALGVWLFGLKPSLRNGLGVRQYASRNHPLLRKSCTVRLLGEPGVVPIQRQHLRQRKAIPTSLPSSDRISNLFAMTFLKDLRRNESRL